MVRKSKPLLTVISVDSQDDTNTDTDTDSDSDGDKGNAKPFGVVDAAYFPISSRIRQLALGKPVKRKEQKDFRDLINTPIRKAF
jgi:hypothetical protein